VRVDQRSRCPINLALEVFGDRWSLLIIRDMMFAGKRHYREFLKSDEKISSKILADRLNALVETGVLTRADDPSHKQKAIYSLTETGITLLPLIAEIGIWGRAWQPVTDESTATAAHLEQGGHRLWRKMMSELRRDHLSSQATVEARRKSPH
jgi:DNA-binding HxlR family transcriptional regulator